jgi:hypothetical protein
MSLKVKLYVVAICAMIVQQQVQAMGMVFVVDYVIPTTLIGVAGYCSPEYASPVCAAYNTMVQSAEGAIALSGGAQLIRLSVDIFARRGTLSGHFVIWQGLFYLWTIGSICFKNKHGLWGKKGVALSCAALGLVGALIDGQQRVKTVMAERKSVAQD